MKDEVVVLLLALVLDLVLGEPPNALHPVVWMGKWIGRGERHAPVSHRVVAFVYGALVVLSGLCLTLLLMFAVLAFTSVLHPSLALFVKVWLLKSTFALMVLVRAACAVQAALRAGNLPEARRLLSWHLVSRDTSELDEALVAAATIESVAENFSDGIVAPLLCFMLFGLPGALAYRFANSTNAMLGYRDARREYLGKFAARPDDVLNLMPSRLAAFLLMLGAVLVGERWASAWRIMQRDHAHSASPNAGWPMSAMADALDVTLEKVGHYRLAEVAA